jgi:hypothetical protein
MPVNIKNRSDQIIQLRLNSNATHNIGPGETLRGVEDTDIAGNARVERLVAGQMIEFVAAEARGPRSKDMRAEEAVEHIRRTPRAELDDFLSEDETRVSVRRAIDEKNAE